MQRNTTVQRNSKVQRIRNVQRNRAPNGPGWAEESQPMGYPTFAQPTHGLHIHLKKVLKDSFACYASESYLLSLTILLFLKLKHSLRMNDESEGTSFCFKKTKLLTRMHNLIGINNLLTQDRQITVNEVT